MLKLAIAAHLPLVAVATRDTINLAAVIKNLTKKEIEPFPMKATEFKKHVVYFFVFYPDKKVSLEYEMIYSQMTSAESTLLLVNPPRIYDIMFNAGEVPVPRPLVQEFLQVVVTDKKTADALTRGLGGCTIKETAELCGLTMARDGSLTVPGLMLTRKESFAGQQGLTQIDTKQAFYQPPAELAEWVSKERHAFLTAEDVRLRARGLVLDGDPGVGKTSGAKWMAEQFGVPLFRLDLAGTKNKYIGDSERNLQSHLSRADQEEPCMLLIDEVEKIMGSSVDDKSGVTTSMLSQLLWWLAEHKSRVLIIMTTNDRKVLPPELYREGRVDKVMVFEGLESGPAMDFIDSVLKTFPKLKYTTPDVAALHEKVFGKSWVVPGGTTKKVSQSALTTAVYGWVKANQTPGPHLQVIAK
jgi:hypothetical protein